MASVTFSAKRLEDAASARGPPRSARRTRGGSDLGFVELQDPHVPAVVHARSLRTRGRPVARNESLRAKIGMDDGRCEITQSFCVANNGHRSISAPSDTDTTWPPSPPRVSLNRPAERPKTRILVVDDEPPPAPGSRSCFGKRATRSTRPRTARGSRTRRRASARRRGHRPEDAGDGRHRAAHQAARAGPRSAGHRGDGLGDVGRRGQRDARGRRRLPHEAHRLRRADCSRSSARSSGATCASKRRTCAASFASATARASQGLIGASPAMQKVYRVARQVAAAQGDGAHHRRERHRQRASSRSAIHALEPAGQGAVRRRCTARRSPSRSSRASSSGTRGARSPAPTSAASAASSRPTAARCSSTRSARSRRRRR